MRRFTIPTTLALALMSGCAAHINKTVTTTGTLAELRKVKPDVQEIKDTQLRILEHPKILGH